MGATSTAEEIVLKLQQNIDLQADNATSALGRLENQIMREQNSLGRLEQSLVAAKVKLDVLAQGAPDKGGIAAVNRQVAALAKLEEQHKRGKATSNELAAGQLKLQKLNALSEASRSVDIVGYKKQQLAVSVLTDKLGAQRDKIGALGEKLRDGRTLSKQMGDSVKLLGSETGVTDSKLYKLGNALAAIGPYGALAAAGVLVVVGAIGLLVGVILKGISAAGEMRQELLTLQAASVSSAMGFSWLRNKTHESRLAAEAMQDAIGRVNATSAAGVGKLTEYGAQILGWHISAKNSEKVLNSMSMAMSGGGKNADKMAQEVLMLGVRVDRLGQSFDPFERRIKAKLGVGAAQAAIGLGVQLQRLRDNITWIFGGANLDPLLKALDKTLSIFNRGTKSATSMRDSITQLVEGAILSLLRARLAILKMILAWLEAGHSIKEFRSYLDDARTKIMQVRTSVEQGVDTIQRYSTVLKIAAIAAAGLAVSLLVIGLVVGGALAVLGLLVYGIYMLGHALGYGLAMFVSWASKGKNWTDLGMSIVMGIANGITAAAGAVWNALKGVVSGAIGGVQNLLEAHSPSRLMHRIGFGGIGGGLEGGIIQSAPRVERASTHLALASVSGFGGTGPTMAPIPRFASRDENEPSKGGKSGGPTFNFYDCIFGEHTDERTIRTLMHAVFDAEGLDAGVPA